MAHILIIEARFYQDIATMLVENAVKELYSTGITYERVSVPGCFEIPAAMSMAIKGGKYDGYLALGCVIRGETTHYDYVCAESARGLNDLAIEHRMPLGYGIITAENRDQALHRARGEGKNVGQRAALACIQMIELKKKLEKR